MSFSVPFKIGTWGPHTILPITISFPIIFSWISLMVWTLFPFKGDCSFGKSQKFQGAKSGCRGAESPGWFVVLPKTYAWDVKHEQVPCNDEAANHQLPIATAFWVIWIVSVEECSSLMQNLMQICCGTHSVILNVTATQYTCSLNTISCPHWLVQWSHHCSHVCIPVHSPWLPGSTDVTQTVLIILTMAELSLDRPRCISPLGARPPLSLV